jgi:Flp pilus assembly protein TadG
VEYRPVNSKRSIRGRRGSTAVEFALVMIVAVPMLFGVVGVGISLGRAVQATQVTRDVGHMYGLGADLSTTRATTIINKLAEGFDMNPSTGNAVLVLSQVARVFQVDCTAANVSPCTNLDQAVFTHRLTKGNISLRPSAFGTPPTTYVATNGNITATNYLRQNTLVATNFNNVLALAQGQLAWMVEGYFIQPDLNFLQSGFPQINQGVYVRIIF